MWVEHDCPLEEQRTALTATHGVAVHNTHSWLHIIRWLQTCIAIHCLLYMHVCVLTCSLHCCGYCGVLGAPVDCGGQEKLTPLITHSRLAHNQIIMGIKNIYMIYIFVVFFRIMENRDNPVLINVCWVGSLYLMGIHYSTTVHVCSNNF